MKKILLLIILIGIGFFYLFYNCQTTQATINTDYDIILYGSNDRAVSTALKVAKNNREFKILFIVPSKKFGVEYEKTKFLDMYNDIESDKYLDTRGMASKNFSNLDNLSQDERSFELEKMLYKYGNITVLTNTEIILFHQSFNHRSYTISIGNLNDQGEWDKGELIEVKSRFFTYTMDLQTLSNYAL